MFSRRPLYLFITLVFFIPACSSDRELPGERLPYFSDSDFTPQWIDSRHGIERSVHRVKDLSFYNQFDEMVTDLNVSKKIYVAGFFDLQCRTFCQVVSKNMEQIQEAFSSDEHVKLLSHCVSVGVRSSELRRYANSYNAIEGKWHFLHGSSEAIQQHSQSAYLLDKRMLLIEQPHREQHPERLILVDQSGYIRGVYSGTITGDIQRIIEDIHILKKEFGNEEKE